MKSLYGTEFIKYTLQLAFQQIKYQKIDFDNESDFLVCMIIKENVTLVEPIKGCKDVKDEGRQKEEREGEEAEGKGETESTQPMKSRNKESGIFKGIQK